MLRKLLNTDELQNNLNKENDKFKIHIDLYQVVVTIRLYGYMDTNTINKGKRDKIKKFFIENKYVNPKLKKRGGNSVS